MTSPPLKNCWRALLGTVTPEHAESCRSCAQSNRQSRLGGPPSPASPAGFGVASLPSLRERRLAFRAVRSPGLLSRSTRLLRLPLPGHLLRFRDLCRRHFCCETIAISDSAGANVSLPPRIARCREVVPFVRQHVVLRHALPAVVHKAEVILGGRVALLGRAENRGVIRRGELIRRAQGRKAARLHASGFRETGDGGSRAGVSHDSAIGNARNGGSLALRGDRSITPVVRALDASSAATAGCR